MHLFLIKKKKRPETIENTIWLNLNIFKQILSTLWYNLDCKENSSGFFCSYIMYL